MALLIKRELFFENIEAQQPKPIATDTWMGIYYPVDTRVGHVNIRNNPDFKNGIAGNTLDVTAKLSIEILSFPAELLISGTAWSEDETGLKNFRCDFNSSEYEAHIKGVVENSVLNIEVRTGDESFQLRFPVNQKLHIAHGGVLNAPHLEPGEETVVQVFDPTSFSVKKAKIMCTGREDLIICGERVSAYITTSTISNVTSKAWITDQGEVVMAQLPLGLVLKKISPEEISAATQS